MSKSPSTSNSWSIPKFINATSPKTSARVPCLNALVPFKNSGGANAVISFSAVFRRPNRKVSRRGRWLRGTNSTPFPRPSRPVRRRESPKPPSCPRGYRKELLFRTSSFMETAGIAAPFSDANRWPSPSLNRTTLLSTSKPDGTLRQAARSTRRQTGTRGHPARRQEPPVLRMRSTSRWCATQCSVVYGGQEPGPANG